MTEVNPYEQFESLRRPQNIAGPSSTQSDANPYAQFEPLRRMNQQQPQSTLGSIAMQVPAGFNETLADVLGMPVDAVNWAVNKASARFGVSPQKQPFMGSEFIKKGMGLIGANPDTMPARTTGERLARGAGGGVAAMIAPEAALGGLAEVGALSPRAVEAGTRMFGRSQGVGDLAKSATIGATAGTAGEGAAEIAPEPFKPAARVVGQLGGGGVGALATEVPRAVGQSARGAREFVAPMTEGGRERIAGGTLAGRAENAGDVREALDTAPREIVRGSQPTTFQLTGDMGLGSLEREVKTKNAADFQQREAKQNQARLDALNRVAPEGEPAAVSTFLRNELARIDAESHSAVEQATTTAQGRAAAIGGEGTPEGYGASLRGSLQDAENAARDQERGLWRAVDPDGTLSVGMGPVQDAARTVYGNLTAAAQAGLSPAENTLLRVIGTYQPTEPFRELSDLRSAISAGMRSELSTAGRSPAYARMIQLRGAVENAIGSTVEQQAMREAQAVARGQLSPEQTMEGRLRAEVAAHIARRRAEDIAQSVGGPAGSRTSAIPGLTRTENEARGRFGNPPGNTGLPGESPTFDQAARERLNAATAATRERAQTFGQGPVGQVLRTQGQQGNYRTVNAAVPAAIFRPGPGGYESVQAFRRAVGNDAAAVSQLGDYAASSLRRAAMRPDGVLDPGRFATWQRAHSDALRGLPGLQERFANTARAAEAIDTAAAARRSAMDAQQAGTLGKLIGVTDPQDVTRTIGGIFGRKDAVAEMNRLATAVRSDPDARDGLRKAVSDFLYSRFVSNTEAATSGANLLKPDAFQTFIRTNQAALRQVFNPAEVNALRAIATDLQRARRSLNAVRIAGQSNTAQDVQHMLAKQTEGHGSLLTQIILAAVGGFEVHGVGGAATGIVGVLGKNVVSRMRDAGMAGVDDLIKRAMLDPDLARYLIAKAPAKVGGGSSVSLAQQLRRLSVFEPVNVQSNQGRGP